MHSAHSSFALSSDDLEFLSDIVPSAQDGIDEDLTAPGTPWIYYGVRIRARNYASDHLYRARTPVRAPRICV